MAIQNTAKALMMLNQQRQHATEEEDRMLRREVEDGVANGDFTQFYGDTPVAQQLGPQLGKVLKSKPPEHFERSREGAKGSRG